VGGKRKEVNGAIKGMRCFKRESKKRLFALREKKPKEKKKKKKITEKGGGQHLGGREGLQERKSSHMGFCQYFRQGGEQLGNTPIGSALQVRRTRSEQMYQKMGYEKEERGKRIRRRSRNKDSKIGPKYETGTYNLGSVPFARNIWTVWKQTERTGKKANTFRGR